MPVEISDSFIHQLTDLRKTLHQYAELSGSEKQTASLIKGVLEQAGASEILTDLGGYGLAGIFEGEQEGPTILFRAELDALPIRESLQLDYASKNSGVSHKCGHDGHMTILSGLARLAGHRGIKKGRLITLFQPAEETGQGAAAILKDENFNKIVPDYVFALHNLPGFEENAIIIRNHIFASASRGLVIRLKGHTSHAGHPEDGNSPALATATLIKDLTALPAMTTALNDAALITIVHARLGAVAFGTTPGDSEIMATLGTHNEDVMEELAAKALKLIEKTAEAHNLEVETYWTEIFEACLNSEEQADILRKTADYLKLPIVEREQAFPWSEDFGRFTQKYPGVLFGLGAGKRAPQLHTRDYDFPDALLKSGVSTFAELADYYLTFKQNKKA